jgi:hypothetical protein
VSEAGGYLFLLDLGASGSGVDVGTLVVDLGCLLLSLELTGALPQLRFFFGLGILFFFFLLLGAVPLASISLAEVASATTSVSVATVGVGFLLLLFRSGLSHCFYFFG